MKKLLNIHRNDGETDKEYYDRLFWHLNSVSIFLHDAKERLKEAEEMKTPDIYLNEVRGQVERYSTWQAEISEALEEFEKL